MFCPKCGYELNNGDDFCSKCGTKVNKNNKENIDDISINENKIITKKKIPIYIIIIAVLILIIILLFINFNIFKRKIRNSGHFEKINGIDTYIENGNVVPNTLVSIRGKKVYFVDENGHKKKNTWEIIDNDGTYGYFGSLGELVKNKIREINGKKYYFDEEGKLVTNKEIEVDGVKYKSNSDGEIYTLDEYKEVESKVAETVIAKTTTIGKDQTQLIKESQILKQMSEESIIQQGVQNTTQQNLSQMMQETQQIQQTQQTMQIQQPQLQQTQQSIAPSYIVIEKAPISETNYNKTNNEIVSPADNTKVSDNENFGPGIGLVDTYKKSYVNEKNDDDNNENDDYDEDDDREIEKEVKIKSTEKIEDVIDGDEYECKVTLVKAIMQGKNEDETDLLNETIDELMDVLWDEVESIVNDYESLPKSVTFSNPTLGTVSKDKIIINLSGSITLRTGGTKSLKYRITYDRNDENGDIVKIS